jgi:hypothetical protein
MQNLFVLRCINTNYSTYRLSSSSVKPSLISRIRYVLNHYWLGSKLLYQNYKSIRQIKQKFASLVFLKNKFHLLLKIEMKIL